MHVQLRGRARPLQIMNVPEAVSVGNPAAPWVKQHPLPHLLPRAHSSHNKRNAPSNTLIIPKTLHQNPLWIIALSPHTQLLPVLVLILRVPRGVRWTMGRVKPSTLSTKCLPLLRNALPVKQRSSLWVARHLQSPVQLIRRNGSTLPLSSSTTRWSGRVGKHPKNTFKQWWISIISSTRRRGKKF